MSAEDRHAIRLAELADSAEAAEIEAFLDNLDPDELPRAFDRLTQAQRDRLVATVRPEYAAYILQGVPDTHAAGMMHALPAEDAAEIIHQLPSDDQADLLSILEEDDKEKIIAELPPDEAEEAKMLTRYESYQAGGLMITEYLAYPRRSTIAELVDDLRRNAEQYRSYDVQYIYIISDSGELVGVLPFRQLLFLASTATLDSIALDQPHSVRDTDTLREIETFFEHAGYFAAPVVDAGNRLLGVVRRSAVFEARAERAEAERLLEQGIIGGEELRSMPLWPRAKRRLSWLSLNIVLNLASVSVIAYFQDTLSRVIALAVFLPIISDMSGCSGNQAVAVTMRELSLGTVRPADVLRVWIKEAALGLLNGLILGLMLGVISWVWMGNPWLGAVVGIALAASTIVAVSVGGVLPLIVKRLGGDPALASGPLLTTITDMSGFFFALSLATLLLSYLV